MVLNSVVVRFDADCGGAAEHCRIGELKDLRGEDDSQVCENTGESETLRSNLGHKTHRGVGQPKMFPKCIILS